MSWMKQHSLELQFKDLILLELIIQNYTQNYYSRRFSGPGFSGSNWSCKDFLPFGRTCKNIHIIDAANHYSSWHSDPALHSIMAFSAPSADAIWTNRNWTSYLLRSKHQRHESQPFQFWLFWELNRNQNPTSTGTPAFIKHLIKGHKPTSLDVCPNSCNSSLPVLGRKTLVKLLQFLCNVDKHPEKMNMIACDLGNDFGQSWENAPGVGDWGQRSCHERSAPIWRNHGLRHFHHSRTDHKEGFWMTDPINGLDPLI